MECLNEAAIYLGVKIFCDQVNDLEWKGVGTYDDTVLNQIDQLMVRSPILSRHFLALNLSHTELVSFSLIRIIGKRGEMR